MSDPNLIGLGALIGGGLMLVAVALNAANIAGVTITVASVNDAPHASNSSYTTSLPTRTRRTAARSGIRPARTGSPHLRSPQSP